MCFSRLVVLKSLSESMKKTKLNSDQWKAPRILKELHYISKSVVLWQVVMTHEDLSRTWVLIGTAAKSVLYCVKSKLVFAKVDSNKSANDIFTLALSSDPDSTFILVFKVRLEKVQAEHNGAFTRVVVANEKGLWQVITKEESEAHAIWAKEIS